VYARHNVLQSDSTAVSRCGCEKKSYVALAEEMIEADFPTVRLGKARLIKSYSSATETGSRPAEWSEGNRVKRSGFTVGCIDWDFDKRPSFQVMRVRACAVTESGLLTKAPFTRSNTCSPTSSRNSMSPARQKTLVG